MFTAKDNERFKLRMSKRTWATYDSFLYIDESSNSRQSRQRYYTEFLNHIPVLSHSRSVICCLVCTVQHEDVFSHRLHYNVTVAFYNHQSGKHIRNTSYGLLTVNQHTDSVRTFLTKFLPLAEAYAAQRSSLAGYNASARSDRFWKRTPIIGFFFRVKLRRTSQFRIVRILRQTIYNCTTKTIAAYMLSFNPLNWLAKITSLLCILGLFADFSAQLKWLKCDQIWWATMLNVNHATLQ